MEEKTAITIITIANTSGIGYGRSLIPMFNSIVIVRLILLLSK